MAKNIDQAKLKTALNALQPANDDHWNQNGTPDMNHMKEAMGTVINRKHITDAGYGEMTRDNCAQYQADDEVQETAKAAADEEDAAIAKALDDAADDVADEEAPAAPVPDGKIPHETMEMLKKMNAADAGAFVMNIMDGLTMLMTGSNRIRLGELNQVFQAYQASRPSIEGHQKRVRARQDAEDKLAEAVKRP